MCARQEPNLSNCQGGYKKDNNSERDRREGKSRKSRREKEFSEASTGAGGGWGGEEGGRRGWAERGKEELTCLMKSCASLSCSWIHFSSSARKKLKGGKG